MTTGAPQGGMFRVFHQNIQGVMSKGFAIDILVEQFSPQVLCLSEHFLSESELDAFHIPGYSTATGYCRSLLQKGGVCILVSDIFQFQVVDVSSFCVEGVCEFAAAKVEIAGVWYFFLGLYRPPKNTSSELKIFFDSVERCLESCLRRNIQSVVSGDFNIDLSVKSSSSKTLTNLMSSFGLRQTISVFTREYGGSSSLIDNIFTNIPSGRFKSSVLITGMSDHHAQVGDITVGPSTQNIPSFRLSRCFSDDNIGLFQFLLQKESWKEIWSANEVDDKFEAFIASIRYNLEMAFPEKKIKIKTKEPTKKILLGPELQAMRESMLHLYSLSKDLESSHPLRKNYIDIKKRFRKEVHLKKATLVLNKISNSSNMQKAAWEVVNEQIPGKAPRPFKALTVKNENEDVIGDPKLVSDFLNDHFVRVSQRVGADMVSSQNSSSIHAVGRCIYLFPTDEDEVVSVIRSLRSSGSSGKDEISSKVLKSCAHLLSSPLAHIINASFECGKFPSLLKTAIIKPLPKKSNAETPDQFRPISVLSTFSKVIEKVFLNRLSSFIQINDLLSDDQYGFRKGLSTIDALFHFVSSLSSSLDRKDHALGVFLDLSKAFDVVNHTLLLSKLENLGFRGKAYEWISSYLLNRSQVVSVPYIDDFGYLKNKKSDELSLISGVPQGSVLGPILFILFVNDISNSLSSTKLCQFADDTSLSFSNKCLKDLEFEVFIEGNSILQWISDNCLKINLEKTKLVNFSLNRQSSCEVPRVLFGDFEVSSTSSTNFLGVVIDSNLNFHEHIDLVLKKLNRVIYLLRRLSFFSNQQLLLLAYYGCFFPILNYGISIWGFDSSKSKSVFIAQKKAVRIVFGLRLGSSCRGSFRRNGLLTFPSLYILNCLVFLKRNPHLFPTVPPSKYNLRQSNVLSLPRHRTAFYERQTFYSSIKMFENLPISFKLEKDILKFKRDLKLFLIDKEFYSLEEFFGHKN